MNLLELTNEMKTIEIICFTQFYIKGTIMYMLDTVICNDCGKYTKLLMMAIGHSLSGGHLISLSSF